ncbi:MAG: ABC transporter permease [Armatimonadetes bacterium]|nr:ABC transporter permease [Armatimonadota bacterium]
MKSIGLTALALIGLYFVAPRLFAADSINSILLWLPLILTVALGEFFVVVARGIDISVGSILGCSAMLVGVILRSNAELPLTLAFAAGGVLGLVLGLVNGLLVAAAKLPSLIVTIGTLASFRGLAFLIGKGETITASMVPDRLMQISSRGASLGGVTFTGIALLCTSLTVFAFLFVRFVPFGRAIFAFGGQPEAATRRGISGERVQLFVFTLSGFLAGIAGVIYLSRFGQVQPGAAGSGFELTVIAAVAIAGTKLTGGNGSILKVVLASVIVATLNVALSILGIDTNWQMLVYGIVLLLMVCGDGYRRRAQLGVR